MSFRDWLAMVGWGVVYLTGFFGLLWMVALIGMGVGL